MRRLLLALLLLAGCKKSGSPGAQPIDKPYADDFQRTELGADWLNTGAPWHIQDGKIAVAAAHNHPLWLQKALPDDVRVEFDATSNSPDGDIKVELFGDGQKHATDEEVARDLQYTASGYVLILGGWRNSLSVIVKQQEHQWQYQRGVPMRRDFRVVPGKSYHWTIERRANRITWDLDGIPFLALDDPDPLRGPGHDRFAFDGWESDLRFDNLKITPL